MGLHRDADEGDFSWPVVSISLGDPGLFRMGGRARSDPTRSVLLESGDVVVMGGAARLAYHGLDRIRFGGSRLLPEGGRINLTLRVVDRLSDRRRSARSSGLQAAEGTPSRVCRRADRRPLARETRAGAECLRHSAARDRAGEPARRPATSGGLAAARRARGAGRTSRSEACRRGASPARAVHRRRPARPPRGASHADARPGPPRCRS